MNIDALNETLLIWTVALESGYVCSSVWSDWADTHILDLESPPLWLLELSLAQTVEDALFVLHHYGCSQLPQIIWNRIDYAGLYLGFLYLRFKSGELKLEDLLWQAGDRADRSRYDIDCSEFYVLLNEIDGGGPIVPSSQPLEERVTKLFAPMVKLVQQHLFKLPAIAP
jgi:hypothetical protein